MKNVIFLDNHDMDRIFERLGKNEAKFKMAYSFLLTTRGIPQVYYGNELMMAHEYRGGDDEHRRPNMPGGWPGDVRSVFTKEGRTDKENEIFEFTKKLNHWRMNSLLSMKAHWFILYQRMVYMSISDCIKIKT